MATWSTSRGCRPGWDAPAPVRRAACGARLVARKGEVTRHHFAHHARDSACWHAAETNLHAMAKHLLARERRLVFPRTVVDVGGEREQAFDRCEVWFDSVRLERRLGLIVPDVVLTAGGRELVVEVFVTHRCDDDKVAKIRAAGIAALEVDLASCRGLGVDEVARQLVEAAPRAWLFNPKIEAVRRGLEARVARREARLRSARERRVADVLAALDANPPRPGCGLREEGRRLAEHGRVGPTVAPVPGEAGFLCTAQDWKVAVVARWVLPTLAQGADPAEAITLPDVFRLVEDLVEDLVAPACRRPLSEPAREAVLEARPGIVMPFWAVRAFLERLATRCVVRRTASGGWRVVSPTRPARSSSAPGPDGTPPPAFEASPSSAPTADASAPPLPPRDPDEDWATYEGIRLMQAASSLRRTSSGA